MRYRTVQRYCTVAHVAAPYPNFYRCSRDDQEQQGEEVRGLVGAGVNERGVGVVSTVGIVGVLAGSFGRVMCSRSGFLARGPVV